MSDMLFEQETMENRNALAEHSYDFDWQRGGSRSNFQGPTGKLSCSSSSSTRLPPCGESGQSILIKGCQELRKDRL